MSELEKAHQDKQTIQAVLAAIATVPTPNEVLGQASDLVSAQMIKGLSLNEGKLSFAIEISPKHAQPMERVRRAVEEAVIKVAGIETATIVLTAEKDVSPDQGQNAPSSGKQPPRAASAQGGKRSLDGVQHIVAVASGKGGVGKSTTAVNLAVSLAVMGLRVGILDADIYGPSLPRAMGLSGGKPHSPDGKTIIPLEAHGVKVMSIGFMVAEDTAMIWRGPMVQSALQQLLYNAAWGELDILVVDMPPGTGDAQLTMAQNVPLSGAVIVSTPQDLALLDARKGINMFEKVQVPILGLIENMSQFFCPNCNQASPIFGHDGARLEAQRLGAPFLGALPLTLKIREQTDAGKPVSVAEPQSAEAQTYGQIATSLWKSLKDRNPQANVPTNSM